METTNTETRAAEIASTIIGQINALDFWARIRWGVKAMLSLSADTATGGTTLGGVQFNCNKRIKILIKLDASDTYTVEIGRMKGRFDYVQVAEREGVYADALVQVIDREFSKAFGSV